MAKTMNVKGRTSERHERTRVCPWCSGAPLTTDPASAHEHCQGTTLIGTACLCAEQGHVPNPAVRTDQARHCGLTETEVASRDTGLNPKQARAWKENIMATKSKIHVPADPKAHAEGTPLAELRKELTALGVKGASTLKKDAAVEAFVRTMTWIVDNRPERVANPDKAAAKKSAAKSKTASKPKASKPKTDAEDIVEYGDLKVGAKAETIHTVKMTKRYGITLEKGTKGTIKAMHPAGGGGVAVVFASHGNPDVSIGARHFVAVA